MSLEVVRACNEDAADIVEIKKKAFKEEFTLYGEASIPPNFESIENQKIIISKSDYYKIVKDRKIIGGVCVVPKDEGKVHLSSIYIDPSLQNQGIGHMVICMIEELYSTYTKWFLETPHLSYKNHRFYERLGYIKIGEHIPEYAEGSDFVLFNYEKIK